MILILSLFSNHSDSLSKLLETVPSELTTIGITVNPVVHSFCSLERSKYLSIFSLSFIFTPWQNPLDNEFSFYYHFTTWEFFFSQQRLLAAFHWSLSDSKSYQVTRTLLSIRVDLSNVVVRMDSILPRISNSSSPFSRLMVTVPSAYTMIGIILTPMVHNLFSSLARSKYLSIFLLSFIFTLPERYNPQDGKFSFVFLS